MLATLVGGHRRKLFDLAFEGLSDALREAAFKLLVLLRLAVLLHRSRTSHQLPDLHLVPGPRSLEVRFPAQWLASNPLTLADLGQETGGDAHIRTSISSSWSRCFGGVGVLRFCFPGLTKCEFPGKN